MGRRSRGGRDGHHSLGCSSDILRSEWDISIRCPLVRCFLSALPNTARVDFLEMNHAPSPRLPGSTALVRRTDPGADQPLHRPCRAHVGREVEAGAQRLRSLRCEHTTAGRGPAPDGGESRGARSECRGSGGGRTGGPRGYDESSTRKAVSRRSPVKRRDSPLAASAAPPLTRARLFPSSLFLNRRHRSGTLLLSSGGESFLPARLPDASSDLGLPQTPQERGIHTGHASP